MWQSGKSWEPNWSMLQEVRHEGVTPQPNLEDDEGIQKTPLCSMAQAFGNTECFTSCLAHNQMMGCGSFD